MAKLRRLLPLATLLAVGALHAAPAMASSTQQAIFQDDNSLKSNTGPTMAVLKGLGVTRIRVSMIWNTIAPRAMSHQEPAGFKADDPNAPGYDWSAYDTIDRIAQQDGISVYFMLTGPAPQWATGSGSPGGLARRRVGALGQPVRAVRQGGRAALRRQRHTSRRRLSAAPGQLLVDLERAQLRL